MSELTTPLSVDLDTASKMTQLSKEALRREFYKGRLSLFKVRGKWIVRYDELERFIAASEVRYQNGEAS